MKDFLIFFSLVVLPLTPLCQTFPKEGTILNYRLVGFETPMGSDSTSEIAIAEGNFGSEDSFNAAAIIRLKATSTQNIIELPHFGAQYTWQATSNESTGHQKSALRHFSTGMCPEVDTQRFRLRILPAAGTGGNGYIMLDGDRVMYDMKGQPVWYLPAKGELSGFDNGTPCPPNISGITTTDMKPSPLASITTIIGNKAYEVNYDGEILWKAPKDKFLTNDEKVEYHHQFSRLPNGNYLILAYESALVRKKWQTGSEAKTNIITDSEQIQQLKNDTNYSKNTFGVLIEYSPSKKILWSWKSSKYFGASDLAYRCQQAGHTDYSTRENAFYFDENEEVIYLSMKSCSRILKIKYPSGKILETYGERFRMDSEARKNGPFFGQHACKKTKDGLLYLFNNNVLRDSDAQPEVVAFREPSGKKDSLTQVWRYKWAYEDSILMRKNHLSYQGGGNVEELDGENMFVYVPGLSSRLLIINRKNEILWSAASEKWDNASNEWVPLGGYRASFCSREALEALIWNNGNLNIALNHDKRAGLPGIE